MDPVFHSLVPNRELEELRRDAERWRALAPHLRTSCDPGSEFTWLHCDFTHDGVGLTVEQIVDRLVQQRAAGGGKEGA